MEVHEISDLALDYLVAKAEGKRINKHIDWYCEVAPTRDLDLSDACINWKPYSPSHNWELAGPIIGREKIAVYPQRTNPGYWDATIGEWTVGGKTATQAAMRAYITHKLGPVVTDGVALNLVGK
jgi:hypothetical protein